MTFTQIKAMLHQDGGSHSHKKYMHRYYFLQTCSISSKNRQKDNLIEFFQHVQLKLFCHERPKHIDRYLARYSTLITKRAMKPF